ncbi:MAG: lactate utilization protein [Chloroflexi bacterium]|nr:lactate utilization protein [Chloroflexota bacterium]
MPAEEHPNKAAFLQRVREALGRSDPLLHMPDHPTLKAALPRQEEKVRTVRARIDVLRAQNLKKLAETATAASWHVHGPIAVEEAAEVVAGIASGLRAKHVVRSTEDVFRRVNVDSALRRSGISPTVLAAGRSRGRSALKGLAFEADLGITGVSYAIAETGTCVVTPRKGIARLTSLAPPAYIALVEADQVLGNLDEYFALTRLVYQKSRGRTPTYVNFISGPSRTADIEQTLTIGVHGPGVVHMVLIA